MASIADMIDFVIDGFLCKCDSGVSKTRQSGMKSCLLVCYAAVAIFVFAMYDFYWRRLFRCSSLYFVGSCFQTLGFLALVMKVTSNKTVEGISSRSLVIFAASLSCRVFATIMYDGYLPVDKTGDMWIQIMDGCSLACAIYLLYLVHKTHVHTYQEEHDELSILPIVVSCVTSSFFIRAELNRDPLFDVIWALSLNLEIFQMLPQLYMLTKAGGFVDNTTAHYVMNIFMGCVCRFTFWIWATPKQKELAGPNRGFSWNMNVGAYYILGAYIIQTLIMLDFMFYYVRAWWRGHRVYLPKVGEEMTC